MDAQLAKLEDSLLAALEEVQAEQIMTRGKLDEMAFQIDEIQDLLGQVLDALSADE